MRLIRVRYQVLPAVLDAREAMDNPVLIHPEADWHALVPGCGADNRRNLLLAIQFDDFDKEIDEYAKTLSYDLYKRAYKMCTPKEFV